MVKKINIQRIPHRHDAVMYGEARGTDVAIMISLILLLMWFIGLSPFSFRATVVLSAFCLVAIRYYGSYAAGRQWDHFERERLALVRAGINREDAFKAVAASAAAE